MRDFKDPSTALRMTELSLFLIKDNCMILLIWERIVLR